MVRARGAARFPLVAGCATSLLLFPHTNGTNFFGLLRRIRRTSPPPTPKSSAVAVADQAAAPRSTDVDVDEGDSEHRLRTANLKVGQVLTGVVNRVESYGAFVDVGAETDGLVHISQLINGYVFDVSDYMTPGQMVKVKVRSSVNGKFNLKLVRSDDDAENVAVALFKNTPSDEWLEGRVTRTSSQGIQVSVPVPGTKDKTLGFVHISNITDAYIVDPDGMCKVGDVVKVRVVGTNKGAPLSLSMKDVVGSRGRDQDVSCLEDFDSSKWCAGRVERVWPGGVYVDIEVNGQTVNGLVLAAMISPDPVPEPAAQVEVGQNVTVRIIGVQPKRGQVHLTMLSEEDELKKFGG